MLTSPIIIGATSSCSGTDAPDRDAPGPYAVCESVALNSVADLNASPNLTPTPDKVTWEAIAFARDWIQEYREGHQCKLPLSVESLVWQSPAIRPRRTPSDSLPKDGWGRRIIYRHRSDSFELRSPGADGSFDTPDDITFEWHPRNELQ